MIISVMLSASVADNYKSAACQDDQIHNNNSPFTAYAVYTLIQSYVRTSGVKVAVSDEIERYLKYGAFPSTNLTLSCLHVICQCR